MKLEGSARLAFWQGVTAATLLVGYAAYYICRSNLSVAAPLIVKELGPGGVDKRTIGLIASAGVLAYAIGKLVNGVLGDFLGGRFQFLLGMGGAIAATVWFGLSAGVALFVGAWVLNRFMQSAGWVGLVKVASQWFSADRYGTVMGILSLSFLFGDAAGRVILGLFLSRGAGWREVFFAAAACLALAAVATFFLLKPSPEVLGLPAPAVNPRNVYGSGGDRPVPEGLRDVLLPYLVRPAFWYVCVLSFGLTLIREAFLAWTPLYLVEAFGIDEGSAAQKSALFPFLGGISVIAVGLLSDRRGTANRMRVALPFLCLATVSLLLVGQIQGPGSETLGLVLISATALFLIGPYSLLAGAIALDLGGRRGSSTAAGLIDCAGYLGGVLSGYALGSLVQARGWSAAFLSLTAVAALTTVVAFLYCGREFPPPGEDAGAR
jgi:OPA family glycerol-3-phosphate transporter-like MFS transporter